MSISIEITSSETTTRSGVGKVSQKPYSIVEQIGYVHTGNSPYPEKLKLTLPEKQPPYAPGFYELADSSYMIGKYGELIVRPKLIMHTPSKTAKVG